MTSDDDLPLEIDPPALAARLGITLRTLRAWIKAGAIPSPAPGPKPRFSRSTIVLAHAVLQLRRQGIGLPEAIRFLHKKSEAELREIAGLPPAVPRSVRALPPGRVRGMLPADASKSSIVPPPDGPISVRPMPLDSTPPEANDAALVGSEWRRIELLPGLELHVRKDAPAFVQGLAAAIAAGRFSK